MKMISLLEDTQTSSNKERSNIMPSLIAQSIMKTLYSILNSSENFFTFNTYYESNAIWD